MGEHIVAAFDAELAQIGAMLDNMGRTAGLMLDNATAALVTESRALADLAVAEDARLDHLQLGVEDFATRVIARRQPMADDLRRLVTAMRVAGDLERIGDLAANIGKRAPVILAAGGPAGPRADLRALAEEVRRRLAGIMRAQRQGDVAAALEIWRRDEEIDRGCTALMRALIGCMGETPDAIGCCTHLMFCAKNVERIGDHVTNIAETIHYTVTGRQIEADRPKASVIE